MDVQSEYGKVLVLKNMLEMTIKLLAYGLENKHITIITFIITNAEVIESFIVLNVTISNVVINVQIVIQKFIPIQKTSIQMMI